MSTPKKSLISNMKASQKAKVASKAETKGAKVTSLRKTHAKAHIVNFRDLRG